MLKLNKLYNMDCMEGMKQKRMADEMAQISLFYGN
jgi:hypothetical protein